MLPEVQAEMNETVSVYQLISRLCSSLLQESDENDEGLSLNNAKQIAFQILLKSNFDEVPDSENLIKELQFTSFELSLAERHENSKQLNNFIDEHEGKLSGIESILWLLLHLKNIDPDPENSKHQNDPNFLKIPLNFQLANKKSSYLPLKSHKLINLPSAASTPDDDCSLLSGILESYLDNKNKKKTSYPLTSRNLKCIEPSKPTEVSEKSFKLVNTWENLDGCDTPLKSFCSESSTQIYQQLKAATARTPLELKIVTFEKLLNDIKLLAIGIESESFKRSSNDSLTFHMPIDLSCDDISNVRELVGEFLETGTCFKRLKTFTSKNPFNQSFIFEGFIFKAFCDCIIKFLNHYRDIVNSQVVETLLEFSVNTRNVRNILIHLAKFLKIHPSSTCRSMLPTGSDFLGLLYNEYTTIFNHDVKFFFVKCLKSCCQIYFDNFYKWLFHGYVDDPHKELFIYFVNHYRPNTKYFFDKAYLIRKQSVPGFLQGYAETILLCGKYTMLLKSYNQVHPLLMLQKPKLKVCLTNDEMMKIRAQCQEFAQTARAACGPSISIDQLMHERDQSNKDIYKIAEIASVNNVQQWRREQEDIRIVNAEKREKQNQGLREELKRIEEKKLVKRMKAIQADRDFLDGLEEIEAKELEQENQILQKRIECYEKLNKQLDDDTEKREQIVVELKSTLGLKEDALNANEPITLESSPMELQGTDEMNNLITKTIFTDAQRNKLKIMSHEYNFTAQETDESNGNSAVQTSDKPLTEAQRNKLKVLGHEYEMVETSKSSPQINVQNCENLTDLQKNRLKVLSSEFNIEKEVPRRKPPKEMSLSLLQVEESRPHLESPMSVTSDHFSNESESHHDQENKSPDEDTSEDSQKGVDNDDRLEMLKAFEEAIEKNSSTYKGMNLNDSIQLSSSYEHIRTTDTLALSRFLQMSLMIPVNTYMDILNNEILKMFAQDLDILSHFKSLRNYFLMMNGEFGSSICHQLFSKLESSVKPSELLNYQSLHMILNSALSQSRHDNNTEKLSFIVQNIPEKFELHSPAVLNMLTMSYKLDWPLTLILNPETMDQYQAIFNYLLKLKRISWVLEECFQMLKELRKHYGKDLLYSQQFRNAQQTRHKMTHFVQCLENHVTRNVLQISWFAFVDDLKSAQSIHCIYRKHTSYLKRVLFLCLLNKKSEEFQKHIEGSFKVILKFHKHLKERDWQKSGNTFIHPEYQKLQADDVDFEQCINYIIYLGNKIIQHGYQKEIYDLLYLIDINGYYSKASRIKSKSTHAVDALN